MDTSATLDALRSLVEMGGLRPVDLGFSEYLLKEDPDGDPRILVAAALLSQRYGGGHVCLDLKEWLQDPSLFMATQALRNDTVDALRDAIQTTSLPDFERILAESKWVGPRDHTTPLIYSRGKLYLARNFNNEAIVARGILDRLDPERSPFSLQSELSTLFPKRDTDLAIPDAQKIAAALASRGRFLILTGGPGTGKTYTVVRILAILLAQTPSLRVLLGAPTGKAAARLTESILSNLEGIPEELRAAIPSKATTLHQMLRSEGMSRSFRHHQSNPLHADVVIVDEASMVDLELMAALMSALPPRCTLILVGDKDQLSSVEAGYVLGELCHSLDERGYSMETLDWIEAATDEAIPFDPGITTDRLAQRTVWLRHSVRFSGESGIGRLAEAVNQEDSEETLRLFDTDPSSEDLRWIEATEPNHQLIDRLCLPKETYFGDGLNGYFTSIKALEVDAGGTEWTNQVDAIFKAYGSFQILCALREGPFGVETVNRWVERRLEQHGLIPPLYQRTQGWYAGRPVMLTRNNYEIGLMNGDVGITLPFKDSKTGSIQLRVVFQQAGTTERYRHILPARLTDLETVYAMTVHKSQGSEFGHVVLMLPDAERSPILTKELLYTGITRAKQRLTLVVEKKAGISNMIQRKTTRSGSLMEWFREP